jgi:hypothetical protein
MNLKKRNQLQVFWLFLQETRYSWLLIISVNVDGEIPGQFVALCFL